MVFELSEHNAVAYLEQRGWLTLPGGRLTVLSGGISNVVLAVETVFGPVVLKQSRQQLRTADPWFSDLDRLFREVAACRLLHSILGSPHVPVVYFLDRQAYLCGMEKMRGACVTWKEYMLAGWASVAAARVAGSMLGRLHEATAALLRHSELPDGPAELAGKRVFEQLRVQPYYRRVCERRPEVASLVAPIIESTLQTTEALCHGDYSPKNLLVVGLAPSEPVDERFVFADPAGGRATFCLVDHEVAHWGDPAMDVGFCLTHLVLKSIRHAPDSSRFVVLGDSFLSGYSAQVAFRDPQELIRRGLAHLGVCILARIDGTSKIEYLPEEPRREVARRIGRRLLREAPGTWSQARDLIESELQAL
ncbi:MAG: hypothetical protein C4297_05095 [Gemmataceae bacterium]